MSINAKSDLPLDILHQTEKPRLLLVEDDDSSLFLAKMILEMLKHDFDTATNGSEAVEKAKDNHYNIIIMNLRMPDMNGVEATQLIRANEAQAGKAGAKILCITADALVGERERCLNAGMDDYMCKPYKPEELEQKLAELMGR